MADECLFCKIAAGAIPSKKAWESKTLYAFHDIHPQAPVHVLVIPREHIASLDDARDGHRALLGDLLLAAKAVAAQEGLAAGGWRLVINTGVDGGQTVHHLHAHVLGRRSMRWPPG